LPGRNPAAVATGLVEFFTKNDLDMNADRAPQRENEAVDGWVERSRSPFYSNGKYPSLVYRSVLPHSNEDSAAVYLDYVADTAQFRIGDLRVTARGLELKTRWHFEHGAELGINVQLGNGAHSRLVKLRGIVVGCHRDRKCLEEMQYLVTLILLDPPEDLTEAVKEISQTLARRTRPRVSIA
jgi:hypothetical protein